MPLGQVERLTEALVASAQASGDLHGHRTRRQTT
jgi:hypothetical protein